MYTELLTSWKKQLQNSCNKYTELIEELTETSTDYSERKKRHLDIGFNIFTLISDYYYRENFHSDIIKSLLDTEREKTLPIFLKMINSTRKEGELKISDFSNFTIHREKERIDILILDDYSKKAIIIENKINHAADTNRQLPKYYEKISKDFEVVAIVYLTLNTSKTPHKLDWSDEEIANIQNLLVIIPSMSDQFINLLDNFLNPAILQVNHIDQNSILRQYAKLIQYLNKNSMDSISLERFREKILTDNNLETALSIRNMLSDLPEHIAVRIEERYNQRCYPFKNVFCYKNTTTVFDAFEFDNLYLKLDIQCSLDGYKAIFWNPNIESFDIKEHFKNFQSLNTFVSEPDRISHIYKHYHIKEEEQLFTFVDHLMDELRVLKESLV
jgi:hypothetical protein